LSRRHVHCMKGFFAALNVETDCVDNAERASNRAGDRPLLVNVCGNGLELRILTARLARAPGADANHKPLVPQMTGDPAPQKAGPAKDGHKLHHGTSRSFRLRSCSSEQPL